MSEVRTRIAPSPTGENLHIGNVYTALINYAVAKKHKGEFIVRIEDTDRTRLVPGSEARILTSLRWLGLMYDEGPDIGGPYAPYRQSDRKETYRTYAEELIKKGAAYYCFCNAERLERMRKEQQEKGLPTLYDGFCKKYPQEEALIKAQNDSHVIRLAVPEEGVTEFTDVIRGKITFENKLIDDQVLLKSDGFPTYHLGVVVDDHEMGISHIIRAEEWISSTPKHILLYNAFEWTIPVFAHTPILRNPDKSKLSKRKNPVWVSWYQEEGFLPEALLNYLGLMGWSFDDGREEFTLEEFVEAFRLEDVKPVGPIFDLVKVTWLNGNWIRRLTISDFTNRLDEYLSLFYPERFEDLRKQPDKKELMYQLSQGRMKVLKDFVQYMEESRPVYTENEKQQITILHTTLSSLKDSEWNNEYLLTVLKSLKTSDQISMKDIYYLITGKKQGLPLLEYMTQLKSKDEILSHLSSFL